MKKRRHFILRSTEGLELGKEPSWLIRLGVIVVFLALVGLAVGFGRVMPEISEANISQVLVNIFPFMVLLPSLIFLLTRFHSELKRRKDTA